jgi:hypothetical protein
MQTLLKARRIGLTVALFSLLMWFPGEIFSRVGWWGPAPCGGQDIGGNDENLEKLVAGPGNEFIGQVSTHHNTVSMANGFYRVHLLNSFQGFTGIAQINQAAGTLSNQITYIGIAGLKKSAHAASLRMSYLSRLQKNSLTTSDSTYQAHIKGAVFAGASGIALINQAAGHMNTQLNALTLTIGGRAAQEFTDVQLGAISSCNTLVYDPEAPGFRAVELELEKGAFQNYTGIWGTSQIAGNLNQVTTIFNVRVTTVP